MTCSLCEPRAFQMNLRLAKRLSCLIALLVIGALAQSAGPEFPNPGNPHMSRDNQRKLGLQAAAQVYQQMPVLPDTSPETQYIRQLGQKLVSTIPSQYSWPFEFHVVAQKEINAFALPGGPMFVNIGTITAASNEAQLAGVMAHEMSHVYMQHSAKQASKAQTTGVLAGIAGAVLGATTSGTVQQMGRMGLQAGAQSLMLKYSRGDESQADAVGAVILHKAGYNPQAMADFFKTLETQGGGSPPQWLSDHPNPGNREQAIEKEIKNWPPETYASDSPAFQKTRQHAMGVRAYTGQEIAEGAKTNQWSTLNKKNGATFHPIAAGLVSSASTSGSSRTVYPVSLPSVLPSPHMRSADLGAVKIDYPENWQITMPKRAGQFVTIAPPAGIAENDVGYGVLLNGAKPPEGRSIGIDEATHQLIQELEQTEALQPLGDPQPITVAGTQGRSTSLHSISPFPDSNGQPEKERDWLVTIPRPDGSVVFVLFVAAQPHFEQFEPTFASMLKSVRF